MGVFLVFHGHHGRKIVPTSVQLANMHASPAPATRVGELATNKGENSDTRQKIASRVATCDADCLGLTS